MDELKEAIENSREVREMLSDPTGFSEDAESNAAVDELDDTIEKNLKRIEEMLGERQTRLPDTLTVEIPFDTADAALERFLAVEIEPAYLMCPPERQEITGASVTYYLQPAWELQEPWYIKARKVGERTELTFWNLSFQLSFDGDNSLARFNQDQAGTVRKLTKYLQDLARARKHQLPDGEIIRAEKMIEPKRGSSVAAWIEYYHAQKEANYKVAFSDLAQKSGYAVGTFKNAHEGCAHEICKRNKRKQNK